MKATAISNPLNIIWEKKIIGLAINGNWVKADARRTMSKCPAIILAANRTARVIGRIKALIVSIKTINGIKAVGVPCGIKWVSRLEVLFNQPYSINPIQIGMAKERVTPIWLEAVNT